LDKRYLTRDDERAGFLDRRSALVRAPEPTSDARRVLETRYKDFERDPRGLRDGHDGLGAPSVVPAVYRDVGPEQRGLVKFRNGDRPAVNRPGLRVRDDRRAVDRHTLGLPASGRAGRSVGDRGRSSYRQDASRSGAWGRPGDSRGRDEGRTIRTVEPRRPGTRIWSGGRANPNPDREVRPGSSPERGRDGAPQVRERPAKESSSRGAEARQAPPSRSDSRSSGRSGGERSGGGRSASSEKRR
jgi:hypothetical protein